MKISITYEKCEYGHEAIEHTTRKHCPLCQIHNLKEHVSELETMLKDQINANQVNIRIYRGMGPRNMHAGEDRSNALLFWRRVSSELPPAPLGYWSDRVLVYTKYPDGKSSITVDSYYHAESGNGFWNHHRYGVTARPTHWMPFPEPPR